MKNTYSVYFYETNFGVLSAYDQCRFLDHYVFVDSISGGNIWYPMTAFGGPMSASETTWSYLTANMLVSSISGGPMVDVCYQDFCYSTSVLPPIKTFCISTVNFVLSGFDETTGKITKIIYDFDDNNVTRELTYNFATQKSPKDTVVSYTYYPKKSTVSTFTPVISVFKQDCCVNTLQFTISTFRCGIFDSYSDGALLDATVSKVTQDIIITLEQQSEKQIFRNMLKTLEPFSLVPTVSTLLNLVEPVPITKRVTYTPALTNQPADLNPVGPPLPVYLYEGVSINVIPDPATLGNLEAFATEDESLILSGDSVPYGPGEGIRIRSRYTG